MRSHEFFAAGALLVLCSTAAWAEDKKKEHSQPAPRSENHPPPRSERPHNDHPAARREASPSPRAASSPNLTNSGSSPAPSHANRDTRERRDNHERNTTIYTAAPSGSTAPHRAGLYNVAPGPTRGGGRIDTAPNGKAEYRGSNNTRAVFRRDGSVSEVHSRNMVITHGPTGSRRVIADRPDHSRVVSYGNSRGYVQRPVTVRGHEYYQRTYYSGDRVYTHVYRPYRRGAGVYYAYTPARYYGPAFYSWAFAPWATPVVYRWGWQRSPWFGAYGGYFTPYPTYASPSLWLTDYLVAATLQDAYQAQVDAGAQSVAADYGSPDGQPGLGPEVKQALADEVQRQLAAERTEAQAVSQNGAADPYSAPPIFDNGPHVLIVSGDLDVTEASGQECFVTEGDILGLNGAPAPDATVATVRVMASKGSNRGVACPRGSMVSVSVEDLVEMQNHMRETLDQGLAQLDNRRGDGALPLPPPAAAGQIASPLADAMPQPDPGGVVELRAQDQEAGRAERQVVEEAAPLEGTAPAVTVPQTSMPQPGAPVTAEPSTAVPVTSQGPKTISMGQTPDEVMAILGKPDQILDADGKKMYVYGDLKVVFTNGRVTDVQ